MPDGSLDPPVGGGGGGADDVTVTVDCPVTPSLVARMLAVPAPSAATRRLGKPLVDVLLETILCVVAAETAALFGPASVDGFVSTS